MKKLVTLRALALTALLLVASVVGCQQQTDIVEAIHIFKAQPPGYPPPPGGWALMVTGSHPAEIQEVFDPGDKMNLGLVISNQLKTEVTFSEFTYFNKGTSTEAEVGSSLDDFGPFEPGQKLLLAFQQPWKVPDEEGEYELRIYIGDEVVASALFNVGIWPTSWGPEMEIFPAPIHEVRVNTSESEPRVSVYIKGGLPQGCKASHGYSIERIDDTINIEVFIKHPKDEPCEEVYGFLEETVNFWPALLSGFISGETYTVNVNDYTTTFVMP